MKETSQSKPVRVLLADDHSMVTAGLAALLDDEVDVLGVATDGHELVEMANQLQPDVIVTDISMPSLNGLDALRTLQKSGNQAKVIILTMHEETSLAAQAFHEGAAGFLTKQTACTELMTAIHTVVSGKIFLTSRMNADSVEEAMRSQRKRKEESWSPLTMRQKEIVRLTAEGKSMKQIAALLDISTKTVESHKYAAMETLGLTSNAELIRYAIRSHLL